MNIGILGTGAIGKTLIQRLSAAGHDVKFANSRGPETISDDIRSLGGHAVTASEAVRGVDSVILAVPLNRIPGIAPVLAGAPPGTLIIDTSNYYPQRDGLIADIEAGKVESVWVAEQFGRPVAKAWNAISAVSFAATPKPAGSAARIAIPVAADSEHNRKLAMALVEATGLDAFDAGLLAESWRQQPGTPCYCTDLTRQELPGALAAADAARSPRRRDIALAAIMERVPSAGPTIPDATYIVRVCRALFM
jgi:predicted dinucleotide-binding enzyme